MSKEIYKGAGMSLYPSLDYFIAIAKHNNITKAANELYVSQQTLSIYLKKLEEYYQIQLFERYPKMCLTPAGEADRKSVV